MVGSITHCDGLCAAAVAWSRDLAGLGIDAEVFGALPEGAADLVLTPGERDWLRGRDDAQKSVLFSAKESVFKCLAPLTGVLLDFCDASLRLDLERGTFVAEIHRPACPVRCVDGRFRVASGLILTSAQLRAPGLPGDRSPGRSSGPPVGG